MLERRPSPCEWLGLPPAGIDLGTVLAAAMWGEWARIAIAGLVRTGVRVESGRPTLSLALTSSGSEVPPYSYLHGVLARWRLQG